MSDQSVILEVVGRWRMQAAKTEAAVAARDFKLFISLYRRAKQQFRPIQLFLRDHAQLSPELRDELFAAATRWQTLGDTVEIWLAEVKVKMQTAKTASRNERRVTGVYKYTAGKAGRNVRIPRT